MNYGFIIDNRKCIGCHACTVACKAEHDVPVGVNRTWVKYIEKGEFPTTRRLFSVMRCNHCADAPCVEICPVQALYTREDGIVDFDNRRCIGCKACMQACPYDALYIDPQTHTAAKCNYCAHRVDIGLEPACVIVCPEHAIISGDLDDPASEIGRLLAGEQVTVRKAAKGTLPKLFYIDGDEGALNPGEASPSDQYLWSSQSSGVGHFAKFAEALVAKADPIEMARRLAGGAEAAAPESAVVIPSGGDAQKLREKAADVLREKTRRVYDVPGKGVLWGWEVSAYIWTKSIATGAFLVPFLAVTFGLAAVPALVGQAALLTALVFLGLTGILLIKDLDRPGRFAYVLLRPQWRSWLARGGYSIATYGLLLVVWGISLTTDHSMLERLAFWGSALFAVITAVYTAFLFAQARGRDFWQSPALSLHMLVHALLAGAAVLAILGSAFPAGAEWNGFLRQLLQGSIVANLLILLLDFVTPHPTADARRTAEMIVRGRFAVIFWLGSVLLGGILPLALLTLGGVGLNAPGGVLLLIGVYLTEFIWVRAPQMIALS